MIPYFRPVVDLEHRVQELEAQLRRMVQYLHMQEQGSAPERPLEAHHRLYPKADGWYDIDDQGTEIKIGPAAIPAAVASNTVSEGPGIDLVVAGVNSQIGLGGDKILLYDDGGSPIAEYDADGTGLTAALGAAAAGNVVSLPAGTISGDQTVPADVALIGLDIQRSILTGLITLEAGASLRGVSVLRTDDSANDLYCVTVDLDAGETVYTHDCFLRAEQAGAGDAAGLYIDGNGTVEAWQTKLTGISVSGSSYGAVFSADAGVLYQYNGAAQGMTAPYNADRAYTSHVEMTEPSGEYIAPGLAITFLDYDAGDPPGSGAFVTIDPATMEWEWQTNNWPGYVRWTITGADSYTGNLEMTVHCIDVGAVIGEWYPPGNCQFVEAVSTPFTYGGADGEPLDGETVTITAVRKNTNGIMQIKHGPAHSHGHYKVTELKFGGVTVFKAYGA
jgi:hypothetical protein